MDSRRFNNKKKIVRRRRYTPYRKWNDYETRLLVQYLRDNKTQKPSGRKFYEKFLDIYNLDIDWTLVKNKVRNIKTLYQKAKDWLSVQETKDVDNVASSLEKMCPHYFALQEMFDVEAKFNLRIDESSSVYNSTLDVEDLVGEAIKTSYSAATSPQIDSSINEHVPIQFEPTSPQHTLPILIKAEVDASNFCEPQEPQQQPSTPIIETQIVVTSCTDNPKDPPQIPKQPETKTDNVKTCSECQQTQLSNFFVKDLMHMLVSNQKDKQSLQKANLDLEERKFAFEKERALRELDLKQKEIERNERLQILVLESKERIAMQELKFKYNQL